MAQITTPTVGATGWNTATDALIAQHNALDLEGGAATVDELAAITADDVGAQPLGQGAVPRFTRAGVTVVSNFASGHGWTTASAGGATVSLNDTADFAFGTQSIKVVTAGGGSSTILEKTGLTTLPQTQMYRLWVKADSAETLSRLRLFVASDSGFANYYNFEVYFSEAVPTEVERPYQAGEWVPVAFPWSTATVGAGSPTLGSLTFVRILINDRNVPATVHIGRLDKVPYPGTAFPAGVVSMTYDDSFLSQYTIARAHLDTYGYAGTLFPILGRIDAAADANGTYLTSAQVDLLAFQHGWEVGGHATTLAQHGAWSTMNSAQRTAELTAVRAYTQERGYNSSTFAYPSGITPIGAGTDMRPFYGVGRLALGRFSASGADELPNPAIPLRLYGQNPTGLTLAQMKAEVDRAAANKTWLIFLFHDIVAAKAKANDVTTADHLALVDYIAASGLAVKTMYEVLAAQLAA